MVSEEILAKHPDDQMLGKVIADKFCLIDILGVGGFGSVYEAIQEPVGRPVALKLVHRRHLSDEHLRQRFFREARVVAQLSDPSVVTLYDYGEEPEFGLYMVFELVRGRTIHQVLRAGPQDPTWTAHIMLQILSGLEEAHAMGMVHRDIKPGNVMVVEDAQGRQRARLLDFGIAKVMARPDGESSLETKEGLVLGTPRYMSPEQARGRADVDARSDLYSLAVLGYAVLAGKNPFERASVIETIMAHVQTPPPPLDPGLGVPAEFETVLLTALSKHPDDRFQSAGEMAQAIHAAFATVDLPGVSGRSAPRGQLGSPISGLITPTPRPVNVRAATVPYPAVQAAHGPLSSSPHGIRIEDAYATPSGAAMSTPSGPVMSTPRPFSTPEVDGVGERPGEVTHLGLSSGYSTDSQLVDPSSNSRMPMIIAALTLVVLLVAGALWMRQNLGEEELIAEQIKAEPKANVASPGLRALAGDAAEAPPPIPPTGAASDSDRPSADRPSADRPSGAVGAVGAVGAASDRRSSDRPSGVAGGGRPSRSGSPAARLPTEPLARARAQVDRGDTDAAVSTLARALQKKRGTARAKLYAAIQQQDELRSLLRRSALRRYEPVPEARREPKPKKTKPSEATRSTPAPENVKAPAETPPEPSPKPVRKEPPPPPQSLEVPEF